MLHANDAMVSPLSLEMGQTFKLRSMCGHAELAQILCRCPRRSDPNRKVPTANHLQLPVW